MASQQGELGPICQAFKRHIPFAGNAGVKDAKGNSINMTFHEGRMLTPNQPEFFELSRRAEIREDDIFVCGYPKTGCHWVWETLSMIMKGKGEFSTMGKGVGFLEFSSPELYNAMPSPRLLNTHNEFDWLPPKVQTFKNKILLTTRNPKDVAVSLYNHHVNLPEMYNYHGGEFPDWFPLFLEGKVDNGNFFDYHLHWQQAITDNPDHPILVLKYEDCKKDLQGSIKRMAEFIERPLTDAQVEDIANTINFDAMKKRFYDNDIATKKLIRKGVVGDWKNWLTTEQSEELGRRSEALKGTLFEPIFELS